MTTIQITKEYFLRNIKVAVDAFPCTKQQRVNLEVLMKWAEDHLIEKKEEKEEVKSE